jgi:hypothetical protein
VFISALNHGSQVLFKLDAPVELINFGLSLTHCLIVPANFQFYAFFFQKTHSASQVVNLVWSVVVGEDFLELLELLCLDFDSNPD